MNKNERIFSKRNENGVWETSEAAQSGFRIRYFVRFIDRKWTVTTDPYEGEPADNGMGFFEDSIDANKTCSIFNEFPDEFLPEKRACTVCGTIFGVSKAERKWFEDRGFAVPKRCRTCRAKKNQRFDNVASEDDSQMDHDVEGTAE